MRRAWVELRTRPLMIETVLLTLVTMLDVWWTLYVVRSGLAIEANPLMAWALERGTACFVGLKMLYLVPAVVAFEWVRGFHPSFAHLAAKAGLWGYVGFYIVASIQIHRMV